MILPGIMLGIMTALSIVVTFTKLPGVMKRFFLRHQLLSDISATLLSYVSLSLISKSLTAVVGAMTAGLLLGSALFLAKDND